MSTTVASTPAANATPAETTSSPAVTAANTAVTTSPTTTAAIPGSAAATAASASAAATQPYASASLYVGDLNNDVTEALLFEIFNAVGPVASVRVCRDAATRRSLGYAYVNFHRLEDAERALDTLNFKMIRNRACRIMWSHRDPALRRSGVGNVFVNHLAKDIDNKQLYDTFSMFGNILSCKVATNSKRESLGYGFVHYETDESANAAIQRVDGKVISNEKVSVQKFMSKKERPSAGAKNKYTNVFIKNLPLDITVARLEEMFREFGTITSSTVNIPADRNDDKARAFGFLNFETSEQAAVAVTAGNNIEIQGKKLFVARAQKKEERQKELSERFENLKLERAKKYAGVNLFVKNLSDDIDDERLTNEFIKFGQISSATVMKDANTTKSRGFGFVCFSTPEEATKAVTEMNGKMLESKPLYVALAQRKDQRRAQLEAQYAAKQKLGPLQGGFPMGPGMGVAGYPGMGGMQMMFNPQQMLQQRNFMNYPQQAMLAQQQAAAAAAAGIRWNPNQQNNMMGMVGGNQNQNQLQQQRPQQPLNYSLMPANVAQAAQMNQRGGMGPQQQLGGPMGANQRGPRNNTRPNQMQQQPLPLNQQQLAAQQQALNAQAAARQGLVGMQQQQMKGIPGNLTPQQLQQQQLSAGNQANNQNIRYNENVRNQGNLTPQRIQQQPNQHPQQISPSETLTPSALANAPEEMRKQMIGERLFPLVRSQEPNLAGKITGMLLEMDNGELLHLLESREALNEKIQEALSVLQQHGDDDQETAQ